MRRFFLGVLGFLTMLLTIWAAGAAPPDVPAADKAQAAKDNNAFALDLYGQLREHDGNLFFSPESISTALAMTYAGARGPTAEQMASTLHFSLGQERLHPAMAALLHDLYAERETKGYQLHTANALWGQKGIPFLPEFLRLVKDNYGAGLNEVDFRNATEQARQTINAWVEKQTNDKIKDLIAKRVLRPDTELVLTNAIYFKGDWASPFKKERTHDAPFQISADEKVSVPLMEQTARFPYLDADTFQALELPYAGNDLSMAVLLPKKADGLAALEQRLTEANVRDWLAKLRPNEVRVALPRFKVESEFDLARTLQAMGMRQAFTPGAEFSGMDGRRDLFISAVLHKAYADVNEEGTEAAAATAVLMSRAAARINPVFRADHPFVFLIRDTRSGSILFLGRVVNPSK
jgi:serine protease inhibitor